MADPSRHWTTQGEPRDREAEQGERQNASASNEQKVEEGVASTTTTSCHETGNAASVNPNEPVDEQTRDGHDTPRPVPHGGSQNRAPGSYNQELDYHFRQLREALPRTTSAAAASTATSSLAAEAQPGDDGSGGTTAQGGLTVPDDGEDTRREEGPPDLLGRARRHILSLEREQRLLTERNGELQGLLDNK